MSMLPGGQSLERVLPDLDELLEDPHAYLSEAPLAFGPRRMYGLAILFAVPGVLLLLSCGIRGAIVGEELAMGVGLLLGAAVWAGWSLMMRGHELVLHPEGVEVIYFDTVIWAPWALFHVEGRPFVPDSDSPHAGLTLPIDRKMVPYVRQQRSGVVLAWGRAVTGPQWRFSGHDEVVLPGRYEINSLDIGELLLVLGHRLGSQPPREKPPFDAEPLPESEPSIMTDTAGWITLPLTRLRLPQCCSRCAGPRDDTLTLRVTPRVDWVVGIFLGGVRGIEVPIPVCTPCKELIEARQRRGGFLGLGIGMLFGVALGLVLAAWLGDWRDDALWLGTSFGFLVGAILGSVTGTLLTAKLPVRLRRYSPSRGLVSAQFENPQIAQQVLQTIRRQDRTDEIS